VKITRSDRFARKAVAFTVFRRMLLQKLPK